MINLSNKRGSEIVFLLLYGRNKSLKDSLKSFTIFKKYSILVVSTKINREVLQMDKYEQFILQQRKLAFEYFRDVVQYIEDEDMFSDAILDVLKYLHEHDYTIEDVIPFYDLSDMQDDYEIRRLDNYIYVVEKDDEEMLAEADWILAENELTYLVIYDNEDEY